MSVVNCLAEQVQEMETLTANWREITMYTEAIKKWENKKYNHTVLGKTGSPEGIYKILSHPKPNN